MTTETTVQNTPMKCPICDAVENFHSLAEYNKERELLICKGCGFICYRVDAAKEAAMNEYYRKDYRSGPTFMNLITTSNKLNYLKAFLGDFFNGKEKLITGDVGCATGYFVNYLRAIGMRATGSEYTLSFRRFAENFYGIPVTEELTEKHKYDFISLYHVLEHMSEPDEKLQKFIGMLAPGGHLLISTPQWGDVLEEASGTGIVNDGMNLEQAFCKRYAKDHINAFTENTLKALFAKCGLHIVKEDHIQYGQTYLLRVGDAEHPALPTNVPFEKWENVLERIERERKALQLYIDKRYQEAIDIYPKFPEAWVKLIYETNGKSPDKQIENFQKVSPILQDNVRIRQTHAMWLYQQQEYQGCLEQIAWISKYKPNADLMMQAGFAYTNMGNHRAALECFCKAAEMAPPKWQEAMQWACTAAQKLPTWDERAIRDVKEKLYEGNKDRIKIEPNDRVMNGQAQKENGARKAAPAEIVKVD